MSENELEQPVSPTLIWRRSSYCSNGACLEVSPYGDLTVVRNSDRPDLAMIAFTRKAWKEATMHVVDGVLPLGAIEADNPHPEGVRSAWTGAAVTWYGLPFSSAEWGAFAAGLQQESQNLVDPSALPVPTSVSAPSVGES